MKTKRLLRCDPKGASDMTTKELRVFFKEHLVPAKLYKMNGAHNGRICLMKHDNVWEVFYSDHRNKVGVMCFDDEQAACAGMKNEIRKLMEQMYGISWIAA